MRFFLVFSLFLPCGYPVDMQLFNYQLITNHSQAKYGVVLYALTCCLWQHLTIDLLSMAIRHYMHFYSTNANWAPTARAETPSVSFLSPINKQECAGTCRRARTFSTHCRAGFSPPNSGAETIQVNASNGSPIAWSFSATNP